PPRGGGWPCRHRPSLPEGAQEAAFARGVASDGKHLHVHFPVSAVRLHAQVRLTHRYLFAPRFLYRTAHGNHQSFTQHLQQIEAGAPRGRAQVQAGVAAKLDDLQVAVDEYAGGRVLGQQNALSFLCRIDAHWNLLARTRRFDAEFRADVTGGAEPAQGKMRDAGPLDVDLVL